MHIHYHNPGLKTNQDKSRTKKHKNNKNILRVICSSINLSLSIRLSNTLRQCSAHMITYIIQDNTGHVVRCIKSVSCRSGRKRSCFKILSHITTNNLYKRARRQKDGDLKVGVRPTPSNQDEIEQDIRHWTLLHSRLSLSLSGMFFILFIIAMQRWHSPCFGRHTHYSTFSVQRSAHMCMWSCLCVHAGTSNSQLQALLSGFISGWKWLSV
jgi:hypothetical protein